MALPTATPTGAVAIPNGNFELGNVSWILGGTAVIVNQPQIAGNWCVNTQAAGETNDGSCQMSTKVLVVPGQVITANATCQLTTGTPGTSASVKLMWFRADGSYLSISDGPNYSRNQYGSDQFTATVSAAAPPDSAYVSVVGSMNTSASATVSTIYMDNFSWNYNTASGAEVRLTSPNVTTYSTEDTIPYRIESTLATGVTITSVSYYYMTLVSGEYINPTLVTTIPSSDSFSYNAPAMPAGQYGAYALVTLSNGAVITTNSRLFTVGAAVINTKEYKASNSYTYLVGESLIGLGGGLPSTAIVTGVETEFNYSLDILVRAKDKTITDPSQATPSVVFSTVTGGVFETTLMSKAAGQYTVVGSPTTSNVSITQSDFSVVENGIADGTYRWTVYRADTSETVTVGGEDSVFNVDNLSAADFLEYAVGVRFYPTLGTKPDYADEGDACIRVKINSWKIKVFFDAGSVEYYFASPDKTQVIKGTLIAYNVTSGNFKNSDAAGVMQLDPNLEIIDGTQSWIGADWTIHSNYPPANNNQIGTVSEIGSTGVGMEYNSLPGQDEVFNNRSRYVFITANFYGDINLESIYGVNGVGRAFAYNGENFYKIYTQPDPVKDRPRHVAFHHTHLALGFTEGRVDISVVGEPHNFDGAEGASSWAIGDSVTGLQPLAGMILGVFGRKSIVGISGTTLDNFATQTLSAKLGAVEYTVTDMGFPVYANAYGVYTLAQTTDYGDFLGNPLSQPVSPWLRPRLIRKSTSDKEVVVAWPVRSKNQYKLAFADGNVLSMTLNYGTQQSATFSKQKYFITDSSVSYEGLSLYDYPSIYPIAISSELDDGGEERIHVAHRWSSEENSSVIGVLISNGLLTLPNLSNLPAWFIPATDFTIEMLGQTYSATWNTEDSRWDVTPNLAGGGENISGVLSQGMYSSAAEVTWVES